jgi:hypothetical protein
MLLVQKGLISEKQLDEALAVQQESGELLGDVLVNRGLASRIAIQDLVAEHVGVDHEPERGFGTGLRAKIVDRESRAGDAGPEPEDAVLPANVVPLPSAPTRAEAVALQREVEQLRHAVELRDERVAVLERELAEAGKALAASAVEPATEHVVLVRSAGGYELVDAPGPPPRVGARVSVADRVEAFVVLKVGRSPLPGDRRPCAFVEAAGTTALLEYSE